MSPSAAEGFRRGAGDGFHVGHGQFVTHADWTSFTSALEFGDDHNEPAATPAEMLPYVTEVFAKAHEHRECERIAEEESCRLGECDHDEHPRAVPDPTVEALRFAVAFCDADTSWEHHDQTDDHPCTRCKRYGAFAAHTAAPDALRVAAEGLAELSAAATQGEWRTSAGSIVVDPPDGGSYEWLLMRKAWPRHMNPYADPDAALIVAAVNLVRNLLEDRA